MIDDVRGKRITVMGLGRFGGGLGVTRWFAGHGADVLVTDLDPPDKLSDSLAQIDDLVSAGRVTLRLGGHELADFREVDRVVANPAVPRPWKNEYLRAATEAGVPITTEIRLLLERLDRSRVIGVTGTAGKSTTTAMIHHLLVACGRRAHLGGNIGGSLLGSLDDIETDDWVVLELSSAMLYWLGEGAGFPGASGISPHVAVLTNLQPNHLDWHETFEHYRDSKENIFRYQADGDHRITADLIHQRRKLPLKLPGDHNQLNGQFALLAVLRAANIFPNESAPKLGSFKGLPHRLELVAEHGGRQFYNDSKCTTPGATLLAVQAFRKPSRVHLIAGGYDKKIDLTPIAAMTPRIAGLYTIGATGATLAESARAVPKDGGVGAGHVEHCETLDAAVAAAMTRMADEDILLLSPGCASWDQFDNYEQRGERFATLVHDVAGATHPAPHG